MKRLVNVRIEAELLEAFDGWAESRGWSRTRAVERLMERATGRSKPAPAGQTPVRPPVHPNFKG